MNKDFYILEKENTEGQERVVMKQIKIGTVEIPMSSLNPEPETLLYEGEQFTLDKRKFTAKQVAKHKQTVTTITGPVKWGGFPLNTEVVGESGITFTSESTVRESLINKGASSPEGGLYGGLSYENKEILNKNFIEFYVENAELTVTHRIGSTPEFKIKVGGKKPYLPNVHDNRNVCSGNIELNYNNVPSARALLLALEANRPNYDLMHPERAVIEMYEKDGLLFGKPQLR